MDNTVAASSLRPPGRLAEVKIKSRFQATQLMDNLVLAVEEAYVSPCPKDGAGMSKWFQRCAPTSHVVDGWRRGQAT